MIRRYLSPMEIVDLNGTPMGKCVVSQIYEALPEPRPAFAHYNILSTKMANGTDLDHPWALSVVDTEDHSPYLNDPRVTSLGNEMQRVNDPIDPGSEAEIIARLRDKGFTIQGNPREFHAVETAVASNMGKPAPQKPPDNWGHPDLRGVRGNAR